MHKCLITKAGSKGQSRRVTIPPGYLNDWAKDAGDVIYIDWSEVLRLSQEHETLLASVTKNAHKQPETPFYNGDLPTQEVQHEPQEAKTWKTRVGLKAR